MAYYAWLVLSFCDDYILVISGFSTKLENFCVVKIRNDSG